jgi:hypothetical protein
MKLSVRDLKKGIQEVKDAKNCPVCAEHLRMIKECRSRGHKT